MTLSLTDYYDRLAPYYQYIFQDWNTSVARQANALASVIHEYFSASTHHILDAACGIGTQALGLARLGFKITASDISAVALAHAQTEAAQSGLAITFSIADMRSLRQSHAQTFDLVLACDNAIPHLLCDEEILQAFEQFYQCTSPDGGCLLSVRDYGAMECSGKKLVPRHAHQTPEGNLLVFDLWEFEGEFYNFTTYLVEDVGGVTANTHVVRGGRYYCVTLAKLEALLRQAGFAHVITLRERYYQPLLLGMKHVRST